jgi:hypothetical protein
MWLCLMIIDLAVSSVLMIVFKLSFYPLWLFLFKFAACVDQQLVTVSILQVNEHIEQLKYF